MTLETWIWRSIIILIAVLSVILPVLTLVDHHRVMNGKEPLNKGKVRSIVIVNKRAIEHEFYTEAYRYSPYGHAEVSGEPDGVARQTSVDFRKVGGKILYTKSIDEELFDLLDVGKTYRVRIRSGCIEKIFTD
ncbi:MAG: hypothetical protein K2J80_13225 [Oscillospiraceae bacterium]|nr:hypothetical protein [Oscillospiraceae bacterium]